MSTKYEYTKAWFFESEIKDRIFHCVDPTSEMHILEIGCFEGLSACFFSDNFLGHSQSTLICVDPFYTSGSKEAVQHCITSQYIDDQVHARFIHNTDKSKNASKITFHNITSDEFFKTNDKTFNFIYVDGCHSLEYIWRDLTNSFECLENGGILWMDDYRSSRETQMTMNRFLECINGRYKLINAGYQLAIKKIEL